MAAPKALIEKLHELARQLKEEAGNRMDYSADYCRATGRCYRRLRAILDTHGRDAD